ncbi:hypothetical protein BU17DRAFT_87799 [Hysterangium stoloniferum]|nr:hypothetical protein BU17DRAFT_87799 [Hysterangium stoloniferum]
MYEPHTDDVFEHWRDTSYSCSSRPPPPPCSNERRTSSRTNVLTTHKASFEYKLKGLSRKRCVNTSRNDADGESYRRNTHKPIEDDNHSRYDMCNDRNINVWREKTGSRHFPIEICDEDKPNHEAEYHRFTNQSVFQDGPRPEPSFEKYVKLHERSNTQGSSALYPQSIDLPAENSYQSSLSASTSKSNLLAHLSRHVGNLLRASCQLFAWAASRVLWNPINTEAMSSGTCHEMPVDASSDIITGGSDVSSLMDTSEDEDKDEVDYLLEAFPEGPNSLTSEFIPDGQRCFHCDRIVDSIYCTKHPISAQFSPHIVDQDDVDFMDFNRGPTFHRALTPDTFESEGSSSPYFSDCDGETITQFLRDRSQAPPESILDINGDLSLTPFEPVSGVLLSTYSYPQWRHFRFGACILGSVDNWKSPGTEKKAFTGKGVFVCAGDVIKGGS